ncbi:NADH-cytochrome b5 reductase-like protein 1 [Elsinoe australis]|uniref:NADH-cytochrome b5 reductase 1 n=1 Tax=Elsinoe australis TaxID=40998 RepID=A0A4V6DUU5_9PEZI|nr:NADH-cytochrome b5 reductase-like protein 1 [Elsinoe australis]
MSDDTKADGVYSLEEVSKHNTGRDLWIVVWNHVYNVAEYQEDHPGGKEFLLENAGTDATMAYEDVGHSTDAREILEKFRIGRVTDDDWTDHESTKKAPDVKPSGKHVVNNLPPPNTHHHVSKLVTAGLLSTTLAIVLGRRYSSLLHRFQRGGFWKGFGLSTLVSLLFALFATQWAAKNLQVAHRDFQSYPAHIKSKQPSRPPAKRKGLNLGVLKARDYQPFPLSEKYNLTHDTIRLVFALPHENSVLGLPTGQHIAIRHKFGDGKEVFRSYTPTSSNKDRGRLELSVKIYPDGALTPWLKELNPGDMVDIRGPKGEMKYHKNLVKEMGMIAGGTGITPMFQIVRRICEDPRDDTKISLLYANKTEKDIMLRDELESLANDHKQFTLYHVLSDPPENWSQGKGRIDKNLIQERLPPPAGDDTKVLICGPDGMMKAMIDACIDIGFKPPGKIAKPYDEIFKFQ